MLETTAKTTGRIRMAGLITVVVGVIILLGPAESRARADGSETAACLPAAQLHQNYPNPFNPRTMIPFSLERNCRVTLTVIDEKGRLIKTLVDRELKPGLYLATWNGRDRHGTAVRAGVYYYRLRADNTFNQGKAIILK
jgi:hypothetical protein